MKQIYVEHRYHLTFRYFIDYEGNRQYLGSVRDPRKYRRKLYNINPTCQLCHKHIDNFDDSNLDHIIPRVKGGHTTKNNLQLTHITCNWQKGERIVYIPNNQRYGLRLAA